MQLPFPDQSFDLVVIQFGVMCFSGQAQGDVGGAAANAFTNDPPKFLERAPYGYFDLGRVAADVAAGGFAARPEMVTIAERSRAKLPSDPAIGYIQGSPLQARGLVDQGTDAATAQIARRFGPGPVDAKIQAHVITVER